jgi:two-component system nitrogen regulation response regulator NtrX
MAKKGAVLIVDDEEIMRDVLETLLSAEGYRVDLSKTGEEGIEAYGKRAYDVVLLDVSMPEMDGIETLKRAREQAPKVQYVMMSGHGTIETAVKATKLGAYHFLEKPLSLENVTLWIRHALDQRRLEEENLALRSKVERRFELVGTSPIMQRLRQLIATAAPTNGRVLISGENGTGKELVARAIHAQSPRREKPFVAVNCAAIPETLIESELLGHEKGSFTGATTQKRGQFEQADGGTLFLDEIGDMSLNTQAKVLRVLQEQQFTRVGGTKVIKVDVRVIAASNKNLQQEIEKGNFRDDLFYRLNVLPMEVPPLRERREDIPALVRHFLKSGADEQGLKMKEIAPDALDALKHYDWPGNIRELRNLVERLLIMVPGQVVDASHVAMFLQNKPAHPGAAAPTALSTMKYASLREARNAFEREYITRKLADHNWNISRTADDLQIERSHLHRKIKLLSIQLRPEA